MLLLSYIFSIMICFGIPIGGAICLRKRGTMPGRSVLVGALAFFISQICIRLPVLGMLGSTSWYIQLQYQPVPYGIFMGLTAGIMEEGARFLAMRFILKRCRSREDGILFGLGHGGIEAILLAGINQVIYLVLTLMGNPLAPRLSPGNIAVGGLERLFAIAFHVGASLIVLWGIRRGRSRIYLPLAILLHTILDGALVILPAVFGVGILGLEIWIGFWGVVTLILGIILFTKKGGIE